MDPAAQGAGGDASKVPTLLFIHGGPFSQYGNRLFDEFQVAVGAGYAVVYSQPAGLVGLRRAVLPWHPRTEGGEDPGTGWGGADYEDLMAVMDAAIEAIRRSSTPIVSACSAVPTAGT